MKTFSEASVANASLMLAVSNTPLFLLRKLQADPVVKEIAESFSGEQIIAEIERLSVSEVVDISEYVRPYVYLVALAMKPDVAYLSHVEKLKGIKKWDWFAYLLRVLRDAYVPTSHSTVNAAIKPVLRSTATSDGAVTFSSIMVPH